MKSADDEIFAQALTLLRSGDFRGAELHFKDFLRNNPEHVGALNLLGALLIQFEKFDEAESYIRRALDIDARSEISFYNHGLALQNLRRPQEAINAFDRAIAINPASAESWNNRGVVFNTLGAYAEAIVNFEKAISLQPNYADAYCNKGKSLFLSKRYSEALAAYTFVQKINSRVAEAWLGQGKALAALNRFEEALSAYDEALKINPHFAEAWVARGSVLGQQRQYAGAIDAFANALWINPNLFEAWLGKGESYRLMGRHAEALGAYNETIAIKPDLADAFLGRGNLFFEQGKNDEALAEVDKALALKPNMTEAWVGRGNFLTHVDSREALAAYDKALSLDVECAEAWLAKGKVFGLMTRYNDAFAAIDRALTLNPRFPEAWAGLGNFFAREKNYERALDAFEKALNIQPDLAEAWLGRGELLLELKQYDEAFASLDRALRIRPRLRFAEGTRIHAKQMLCDWMNIKAEISQLINAVREKQQVSPPLAFLAISSSPADQMSCAKCYIDAWPHFQKIWRGEIYSHNRIRIAYCSTDFREHPVAYLTAGLFERHDKSRFEMTAISFGPDDPSDTRKRIKDSFEHFVDAHPKSDQEVAELIREREIDIAVDLNGLTAGHRVNVFARKAAPVQVNYLGYAGTTGADFFDYILADGTVIRANEHDCYAEKVVILPESFLASDNRRTISAHIPTRQKCELPETGFVFCCFNNSFKIMPEVFDVWMNLLRATPGSVLWLAEGYSTAANNLRAEAEKRGVSAARLIFAQKTPLIADHLARHRLADLALDTLPYNGHTSTSDALWVGVPVVTCAGSTFAGRVAASLLKAIGVEELVSTSLEEYQALALKLACDPALLLSIKQKITRNRDSYPLFDTDRFVRQIETAYESMWRRYQAGELPQSFDVDAID